MLEQATSQNVINVARYYHHETVKIGGMIDDVRNCVRRGLDITTASNYQESLSQPSGPSRGATTEAPQKRGTSKKARRKRPFDVIDDYQTGSPLPLSKKICSKSLKNPAAEPPNRVHRRVIVRDVGKPIYTASSHQELLACLEGCIKGHRSLHDK
ncbi:hypothetical protein E4U11_000249, partial [Claviceps purpurea]